mgnify:CR=1 FL=1
MKNNQFRAYFTKEIRQMADDLGLTTLSVDETNTTRIIYLYKKSCKCFKGALSLFTNNMDYSVKFVDKVKENKISFYGPGIKECRSHYFDLKEFDSFLKECLGSIKSCKK